MIGTSIPPGLPGTGHAINDGGRAVEIQSYHAPDPPDVDPVLHHRDDPTSGRDQASR